MSKKITKEGKVNFIIIQPDYLKKALEQPGEYQEAEYWAQEWGVSLEQLNDAILHTGTLDIRALREYLEAKGIIVNPFVKLIKTIKQLLVSVYKRIAAAVMLVKKSTLMRLPQLK